MVGFVEFMKMLYPRQYVKALRIIDILKKEPSMEKDIIEVANQVFPGRNSVVKFSKFTKKMRDMHILFTNKGRIRLSVDGFMAETRALGRNMREYVDRS